MMDGKVVADRIFAELTNQVSHMSVRPHMTVITCAPNFETKKYLNIKTRKAKRVGVGINVIELPGNITTAEAVQTVQHASLQTDGIIVQLPLPDHLDTGAILDCIPVHMDIDGVHYDGTATTQIHPVAGAIAALAVHHDVLLAGQKVVVVGAGRLVGKPAALWAAGQGADVTTVTLDTENNETAIKQADVLILGAGQPNLITPDMVKPGVVIFDAGTSELGGQLVGDAHPNCSGVASLMTPVPGGIGPVTVAILLRNLVAGVRE